MNKKQITFANVSKKHKYVLSRVAGNSENLGVPVILGGHVSVSSRGAKPRERETGSLQVAYTMRLVLLNVSLHVLVIKSLQETQ